MCFEWWYQFHWISSRVWELLSVIAKDGRPPSLGFFCNSTFLCEMPTSKQLLPKKPNGVVNRLTVVHDPLDVLRYAKGDICWRIHYLSEKIFWHCKDWPLMGASRNLHWLLKPMFQPPAIIRRALNTMSVEIHRFALKLSLPWLPFEMICMLYKITPKWLQSRGDFIQHE